MKDNNKNRKLNFIRIKNALRFGKRHGYNKFKLSNEILKEPQAADFIKHEIDHACINGWRSICKMWKLKLNYSRVEVDIDIIGDDFLNQCKTVRIKYFI